MAMLVAAIERPLTYEDLEGFPDDGKRREVVGGKLYVSPAPLKKHRRLSKRLVVLFHEQVERPGLAEVFHAAGDVRLPNGDQVQPDLLVLLLDHLDRYERKTVFGPPDIVVEFFSPSAFSYDKTEKAELYAALGVPEYWQADPDVRLRSRVVPDLVVDPTALFANLDD